MARSKAQQRVLHTQSPSDNVMQIQRSLPHCLAMRPTAPPASSALFQLGRPTTVASERSRVKDVLIRSSHQSGSSSGQAIDLTLDDDEEEEDEPMGAQQSAMATFSTATAATVSSTASDKFDYGMFGGDIKEDVAETRSFLQTSDMIVPMAGDADSDVDEDWPIVSSSPSSSMPVSVPMTVRQSAPTLASQSIPKPTSVSVMEESDYSRTRKDVGAALDAIRNSVLFYQDDQEEYGVDNHLPTKTTRQQTSTSPLIGNCNGRMGENRVSSTELGQTTADVSSSTNLHENNAELLEDGEIFEEVAPMSAIPIVMRERIDTQSSDTTGFFSHQYNKKQKKRGKKKTKRKFDSMQMKHASPGMAPVNYERTTRQRVIADVPSAGNYMLATLRNGPRDRFANKRPVFQDPPPLRFQNVGGLYPSLKPPPQQLHHPPLPPTYENSQILRVNRQARMDMLSGKVEQPLQTTFSEPMMQGTFKYRSVSVPSHRPISCRPSRILQRCMDDQSRVLKKSCAGTSIPVPLQEHRDNDDFDLDSLRAAALQSKLCRSTMTNTSTVTALAAPEEPSAASMPPILKSPDEKETNLKPASPSSENELRLEILRSMTRNRKQVFNKTQDDAQVSMPSATLLDMCELPKLGSKYANAAASVDSANKENANLVAQADQCVSKPLYPVLLKESDAVVVTDRMANEKARDLEKTDMDDKPEGSANLTAEKTLEFPEYRPLTACTQSVVICLSPEDFSPRKGGDDTRANGTSLQDAIKDMRRKIAEREQEQTNRLLANATEKLSCSMSSKVPLMPTTTQWLSPVKKVSTMLAPPLGDMNSPEVGSFAIETQDKQSIGAHAKEAEVKKASGEIHVQTTMSEGILLVDTAKGRNSREIMGIQVYDDALGASSVAMMTDNLETEKSTCVPILGKSTIDALGSDSGEGIIDFDVIRAEYEQCLAECEEAYLHIVRLSNEVAQLENLLPRADSTVGES